MSWQDQEGTVEYRASCPTPLEDKFSARLTFGVEQTTISPSSLLGKLLWGWTIF